MGSLQQTSKPESPGCSAHPSTKSSLRVRKKQKPSSQARGHPPGRLFSSAPRRAEKGRRRGLAAGPARAARVCPGPDPPLRTWPFPSQASPSSGSASGSASRGRGFNNCSSCSASGPAIVTRSRSAPVSVQPRPGRSLPAGPCRRETTARTARDRAEPSSRSSRPLPGGGGACVSLRALLGRRRKAVGIVGVPARVRVRGGGGGCEAVRERARARGRRWS